MEEKTTTERCGSERRRTRTKASPMEKRYMEVTSKTQRIILKLGRPILLASLTTNP